jgi:hypothetical protein
MHAPQTPGWAAVQNALLQMRMLCGLVEICLNEMAPAERTLSSIKLKINLLTIQHSFLEPEKSISPPQVATYFKVITVRVQLLSGRLEMQLATSMGIGQQYFGLAKTMLGRCSPCRAVSEMAFPKWELRTQEICAPGPPGSSDFLLISEIMKIRAMVFTALVMGVLCAGTVSARQLWRSPRVIGVCSGRCSATMPCRGACTCYVVPGQTLGSCVSDPP